MPENIRRVEEIPTLPKRALDSHKGSYGRLLVVAGSRGMSGAAVLCGSAALRGGVGLVQIACPLEVQQTVASGNPCFMTHGIHQHANGTFSQSSHDEVVALAASATSLAIGPGLGQRPDVAAFVIGILRAISDKPTVLDADGLNALPNEPGSLRERKAPLVMTPHPGEFARLIGSTTKEVQANREELALDFARRWNAVLVLKGHGTIVTDGTKLYVNDTGNPGMATGGTGDVLTGLLASLLGQGFSAFDAASLAVWAHGRAGDLAAQRLGMTSLIASDLLKHLPQALREREAGSNDPF
jgi:NAD(P)H-hydrate epimerase